VTQFVATGQLRTIRRHAPPPLKYPLDGRSGLTDLPVGLAVTLNSIYAVNPRCLTVYFRIGSPASGMRRRFFERGTESGSTESAI
jgi:hypothetical protein